VPALPGVPRGDAALIGSDAGLGELARHLRAAGRFAYDSEFIGELTYQPRLCLVQVATSDRIALIDPLAGVDLKPFWELVADPGIEKIVHAGEQDIEPVFRSLGKPAANVFDTQISAGFVRMAYPVALAKLVQELLGVKLGKGLTFTHWDQRPLSPMQLRYAADDVRYLVACRDELGRRLEAMGRGDWAQEESNALCDPSQYEFDPDSDHLRVRGAASLTPQGLAILREITQWREAAARHHDVPARALLRDDVMIDLSRNPPRQVEKLSRVRGLPRPVEQQHGQEIVTAVMRGLESSTRGGVSSRSIEPSPSDRFSADALWAAAQALCTGQSIDPALVTSRHEIGELYRRLAASGSPPSQIDLRDMGLFRGWRAQALGEPLLRVVRGQATLSLTWVSGSLRTQMPG
jgi:ribonuclease D